MTEQIESTAIITEANQSLTRSIRAVGLSTEFMIQLGNFLPEVDTSLLEVATGRTIRYLVQNHLTIYMQGPSSVRGMGARLGVNAHQDRSSIGAVLDIDRGQLLRHEDWEVSVEPLPDEEWFRHWRGCALSSNYYKGLLVARESS